MVADAEEGGTVRINLRLPANLKQRAEDAADLGRRSRFLFSRDSGI